MSKRMERMNAILDEAIRIYEEGEIEWCQGNWVILSDGSRIHSGWPMKDSNIEKACLIGSIYTACASLGLVDYHDSGDANFDLHDFCGIEERIQKAVNQVNPANDMGAISWNDSLREDTGKKQVTEVLRIARQFGDK